MTDTAYREKPPTRCAWCLKPAWSDKDTCRECLSIEPNLRRGYTDADALTGDGEWITRGGIKVWTGPRPLDDEQARRPVAECGTPSGYTRHRRLKEKSCDACREANRLDALRRAREAGIEPRRVRIWRRADLLREYDRLKAKGYTQEMAAAELNTTARAISKALARQKRAERGEAA